MCAPHLAVFLAAMAAVVLASPWDPPPSFNRYKPIEPGIEWGPCPDSLEFIECGRFEVPMDYSDPSAGKASLMVTRIKYTNEPRLGTLLVMPNGPGSSGVESLLLAVDQMIEATEGHYDIVSWDKRGVGLTFPRADCFESMSDESKFLAGTIFGSQSGIEVRGSHMSGEDLAEYYQQAPQIDEVLLKLNKQCLNYSPDVMQYLGTAANVRDMVALNDHLEGPDQPVNFWGAFYGSVLGIYFANMYPQRVGHLILDGVVDPQYWAERPTHELWSVSLQGAKASLKGFIKECVSVGPQRCAFAHERDTEEAMHDRILVLLDQAYDHKRRNPNAELGSAAIRDEFTVDMFIHAGWCNLGRRLAEFELTLAGTSNTSISHPNPHISDIRCFGDDYDAKVQDDKRYISEGSYATEAISCGDAVDPGHLSTRVVLSELLGAQEASDRIFAPHWSSIGLKCHRWETRAVERYTGPWNKSPAHKILVIGNEGNMFTPLASAKNVVSRYGNANAVLVEHLSYGAWFFGVHSNCTLAIAKNYLVNNILPDKFTQVCGDDQIVFPEAHYEDNYTVHGRWLFMTQSLGYAFGLAALYLTASYVREKTKQTRAAPVQSSFSPPEKADVEKGGDRNWMCQLH